MVLRHADVASTLLEVKGGLNQVAIMLNTELSSAGGDGYCEWVDDEALALPQINLQVPLSQLGIVQGLHLMVQQQYSQSAAHTAPALLQRRERATYICGVGE